MPEFDYEKSIWGENTASLKWTDPTNFRLRQANDLVKDWPGGRVLEVGSGAGQFIRAIKKFNPALEAHASDISESAIEKGRKIPDGVIYALSGEDKLPYPDDYFDAVFVFDVLEHVKSPSRVLAEIYRVLKKNSIFYCFVPCERDATSLWDWLEKFNLKKGLTQKYAGHINFFTVKEFLSLGEKQGFIIKKRRFSEHFLGQLIGVLAFMAMDKYSKDHSGEQVNNERFFKENSGGKFLNSIKKIVNFLITLESFMFCRLRSPNLHVVFKKI